MITQEQLKEYFEYAPDTGVFTRRKLMRMDNKNKVGDIAGTKDSYGYVQMRVMNKLCLAHRLAFLYMTGEWPTQEVDHINRRRDDNRWENLRLAPSRTAQCQNISPRNGSKVKSNTGIPGVNYVPRSKSFHVCMAINGKRTYLGSFDNLLDACARRKSMELVHFVRF